MKKNSRSLKIVKSIQKANYHSKRANYPEKGESHSKVNYSMAFTHGDQMGWLPSGHEGLLKYSRNFKTNYEKKAYWRGVKNRHERDKR